MPDIITQGHTNSRLYVNGAIIGNPSDIGINKTQPSPGTQLVIQNLKIVGTFISINAPEDTIKVIHSLAVSTDTNPTIGGINSIVGSVAYLDPGVI